MSKKDPVVVFYNGEQEFEKLMKKIIELKLKKNKITSEEANLMMYNSCTHNRHLPNDK